MPYGTDVRDPIRILYIDDDADLAVLVGRALKRRGHEMEHVGNGEAALQRLAAGGIDAIALDHSMPGETGIDVLERIGPRGTRPPVVYVTGSADVRIAVQAIKAGADDYVIKDTSGEFYELLIAGIEQVYERWRLRRQKVEDEKAVRDARDRAELLLHEVNHRVANSLGLVAAMVRMQAAVLTDPVAVQALQKTQARITAIAGVHRYLYTSERVGRVEIHDYLEHLIGELQGSLADADHPHRVSLSGARVEVSTDKAVSLGVIIGELVTNAFKYAYDKDRPGDIRVHIDVPDDQTACLTVEDDGIGFELEQEPRGTGFGTRILAAMATNLDAEVSQDHSVPGSRIRVTFPVG